MRDAYDDTCLRVQVGSGQVVAVESSTWFSSREGARSKRLPGEQYHSGITLPINVDPIVWYR